MAAVVPDVDLDIEWTTDAEQPPCQMILTTTAAPCGLPSVAVLRGSCSRCGGLWRSWACHECVEAAKSGDIGCAACPSRATFEGLS